MMKPKITLRLGRMPFLRNLDTTELDKQRLSWQWWLGGTNRKEALSHLCRYFITHIYTPSIHHWNKRFGATTWWRVSANIVPFFFGSSTSSLQLPPLFRLGRFYLSFPTSSQRSSRSISAPLPSFSKITPVFNIPVL